MARRSDDPDFIEALARGLDVIRCFGPNDHRLTLSAIASRAQLTRPTTRRILITLEQLGYVSTQATGFSLTPRVLDLGFAYIESRGLWPTLEPELTELVRTTNESCSIAELDGSDIVYVARVAVPKVVGLRVQIGTRFPAYATSLGKVLLCEYDRDALASLLLEPSRSGILASWQPDFKDIVADLAAVRNQGWALTNDQLAPGIQSVAIPLRDLSGHIIAAANINSSTAETPREVLLDVHLPLLLEAQKRMQATLATLLSIPQRTVIA